MSVPSYLPLRVGNRLLARADRLALAVAATEEPYLEEYIIHLPITNDTIAVPADFYTTKGDLLSRSSCMARILTPYLLQNSAGSAKIRNYDADGDDTYEFALSNAEEVKDIIEVGQCSGDCVETRC